MSFSDNTLTYLKTMSSQAKAISVALGASEVTAQAILGAIGEEYESLGVVDKVQAARVSSYTHDEIRANFELMHRQPELLELIVSAGGFGKAALKWENVVLNDVGPGNIKIHTAIKLLNDYIKSAGESDPLNLKSYTGNYARLVADLSAENNSLSLKFASLMLKEGRDFFQNNTAFAWSTYSQDTKDAILITYYNNGRAKTFEKVEALLSKGFPEYFPGPGGGVSGGLV